MTMTAKVMINNIPEDHGKYIVARLVNGDLWFFASFDEDELEKANRCRREIDGIIAIAEEGENER